MDVGDDSKQVVPLPVRNQVVREKSHLRLSKCTVFHGGSWPGLLLFFFFKGATSFLICFLEN